jgi:glyoxylase-like metal-dependent hydrolase (beta-lactamase superfamily II)
MSLSRRRGAVILASLASLALVATTASCGGIGTYTEVAAQPAQQAPASWKVVFARPVPLRVTAFLTGWVEVGPEILIDVADPRIPAAERERLGKRQWVPVLSYLVEHPDGRRILLDTGVRAGDCAFGTRPFFWVPCRATPGADVVSQLHQRGLSARDLDAVVLSHFHGDHVSGLSALLRDGHPRLVTSRAELAAVRRVFRIRDGYIPSMLQDDATVETVDDRLVPMPIVDRACDFFGDGSLWLVPTPGHTRGHLSAVLNLASGPVLLTFDASHLQAGFDLDVPPGADTDETQARASLERLRALAAAYPKMRVVSGHEPAQWEGKNDAAEMR